MQKKILISTILVTFSSFHSPAFILADAPGQSIETTETIAESAPAEAEAEATTPAAEPAVVARDIDEEDDENPKGTPVAPSTNSAEKAKKREFIRNIALACSAVVVAVVSIILVSNNNGNK